MEAEKRKSEKVKTQKSGESEKTQKIKIFTKIKKITEPGGVYFRIYRRRAARR